MASGLRLNLAAWPAAYLALAALSALLFVHDAVRGPGAAWAPGLEWRADHLWRQPWRLLSAALVHYDLQHLGSNLLGCAVVALFGWAGRLGPRATLAAALAWPLTHVLLLWAPGLARYGGLSGVLHAGVAIGCWALLRQARTPRRRVAALVLLGLCLKVALEQPWVRYQLGWGETLVPLIGAPGWHVASSAHLAGVLAGLLCAGLVDAAAHVLGRFSRAAPAGRAAVH